MTLEDDLNVLDELLFRAVIVQNMSSPVIAGSFREAHIHY
jgi:hypothetical protein